MTEDEITVWTHNLTEAFELGAKGERPGSGCLDWFMADRDGIVGIFTGGGLDLVPAPVFANKAEFLDVYRHFLCRGSLNGVFDDYREWEEQDLVVFDTAYNGVCRGIYQRQHCPETTLAVDDVDSSVQPWFERMTLPAVSFANSDVIEFTKYHEYV